MDQTNQTHDGHHIAFIKARWHGDIVDRCEQGFVDELRRRNWCAGRVDTFAVPGSLEIPLLAKRLAGSGDYAAIVASGFVVDGGIYRHDFVAATVIDALMRVQLDTGVPVFSAVLTPHHFRDQQPHETFFADHFVTKGREAAEACLMTLDGAGTRGSRDAHGLRTAGGRGELKDEKSVVLPGCHETANCCGSDRDLIEPPGGSTKSCESDRHQRDRSDSPMLISSRSDSINMGSALECASRQNGETA